MLYQTASSKNRIKTRPDTYFKSVFKDWESKHNNIKNASPLLLVLKIFNFKRDEGKN